MIRATLVSESLRVGAEISGIAGVKLVGVRRVQVASASPDQSSRWTLIDFEAPDARAGALAEACSATLGQPGWYVDFHTATEQYVVFSLGASSRTHAVMPRVEPRPKPMPWDSASRRPRSTGRSDEIQAPADAVTRFPRDRGMVPSVAQRGRLKARKRG